MKAGLGKNHYPAADYGQKSETGRQDAMDI